MATPYQNPIEAEKALTSAWNPTNEAQRQAIITAASLVPTKPIIIPQPEPDKTDYMTGIKGTAERIAAGMKTDATETKTEQTDLQKMLASISTPSSVDAYTAAQGTSGIDIAQEQANAARRAKKAAQAELAGIQGQVQAVVDQATAENLRLEQTINQGTTGAGGAGAMASGSFLNVRQQEVNRQAAIKALPLQALALAAQAKVASLSGEEEYANSTLAAAQQKLDTTFKLWSDDQTRKQTTQFKMLDVLLADADRKETARIEEIKATTTRNQNDLSDARNFAQTLSTTALTNGQADIAAKLAQIPQPDPTSKTFATDLTTYNSQVAQLQGQIVNTSASQDRQLKALQIQKAQQDLAGGGSGVSMGTYQAGQLTQLLQSQGKPTDEASLSALYKQIGGQGTYTNDTTHNSQIYSTLTGGSAQQPVTTLTGKPLNDAQSTALGYAQRMNDANQIITQLGSQFTGVSSYISGSSFFPNIFKSDDRQNYEQAQRNFINAVLRKESGAAISPTEFDSAAKQYFPQPGDSKSVIDQKTANRERVIANLAQSANVSLQTVTGSQNTSSGDYNAYLKAIGQ